MVRPVRPLLPSCFHWRDRFMDPFPGTSNQPLDDRDGPPNANAAVAVRPRSDGPAPAGIPGLRSCADGPRPRDPPRHRPTTANYRLSPGRPARDRGRRPCGLNIPSAHPQSVAHGPRHPLGPCVPFGSFHFLPASERVAARRGGFSPNLHPGKGIGVAYLVRPREPGRRDVALLASPGTSTAWPGGRRTSFRNGGIPRPGGEPGRLSGQGLLRGSSTSFFEVRSDRCALPGGRAQSLRRRSGSARPSLGSDSVGRRMGSTGGTSVSLLGR